MSDPHTHFKAVQDIKGWFYSEDAIVIEAINAIQTGHQMSGDFLEIGVYCGKSAAFLGFLREPRERFIVCDLFGNRAMSVENQVEKETWYPNLGRETFEFHYLQIHTELPEIFVCNSGRIKRLANLTRTFRFIHVDGSHLYRVVRQDIRTASELLKPGGVVAIDDYRSAHTPGVAAATWEAVLKDWIRPICVTPQKMYATVGGRKIVWLQELKDWCETRQELNAAKDTVYFRHILRFSAKT
jgi:Methyltransferase domain